MSWRDRLRRIPRFLLVAPLAPVLVAVVLLIVGIGGGNAITFSSSPEFCNTCHQMKDEYQSWQASGHHPDVACIDCHSDPGAFGEIKAHVKGARFIYYALTGAKPAVAMSDEAASAKCDSCHDTSKLPDTVKGVRVNHEAHLSKGQACTTCHSGLVHKSLEQKRPDERFHETCQTCHNKEQAALRVDGPTSCNACHVDVAKVTPANHQENWGAQHGKAAVASPQACGECHLDATAKPNSALFTADSFRLTGDRDTCASCHGTAMPHAQPYLPRHGQDAIAAGQAACATCHSSRSKADPQVSHASDNFCSDCHAGVTMPHAAGFLSNHGEAAGSSGNPACQACHSSANPVNKASKYAADTFCSACHAGQPMPHPAQFVSRHGKRALEAGAACQACHSPKNPVNPASSHASGAFCSACHDRNQHPAGWVAKHGSQVSPTCYACHSDQKDGKNSCLACHPGKPGDTSVPWHPDEYWFVTHAKVAEAQGTQACLKCHAEAGPSCTKCHQDR